MIMWTLVSRSTQGGLKKYVLKPGKTTLGRGPSNSIDLPDILASRNHCEIVFDPEANHPVLHDFESKNGTFLNGKRVETSRELEAEDQIRIGHALFEVLYQDTEVPTSGKNYGSQTRALTTELVLHSINRHTVLLNEIAEHLNTVSDLDTATRLIANLAKKVLGADKCSVIMAKDFDELQSMGYPSSITRPAIEDRLLILKQSEDKEIRLGKTASLQGVNSAICVPVLIKDDVAAIFYMDRSIGSSTPFTDHDLELAVGISHQMGLSIQRNEMEAKLLANALHDSLTGLPNKTLFADSVTQVVEKASQGSGFSFAVIRLDLDDFQVVNDFFGYSFGDQLLINLSERLKQLLRNDDVLARLGGDEFGLLVMGVKDDKAAEKLADAIHEELVNAFNLNDRQVYVTAGVGISLSTLGYETPVDLLRNAETAMYRAKIKGKAQTAIFDKYMRDGSIARINLESRLGRAIENHEFRVKYQPVVSLEEPGILGLEALVRWQQAEDFQLTAADFITLAEKTQFIFDIDQIVLRTASSQLVEWKRQFADDKPFWVSINLSGRQLGENRLIPNLQQILEETGLAPNSLNLEFSEKSLTEDNNNTTGMFNKLRDLGVRVSIDDFGNAFSSLSYLRHFPVDYLKVDRSYLLREDWDIANLVMEMAHKLNLKVIAEGVETKEQFDQLKKLNCDFAQGNFISEPVDVKGVGKLLGDMASGRFEPAEN